MWRRRVESADGQPPEPDTVVALREAAERALVRFVEEELAGGPAAVVELVHYAVLSPGKRIRPILVMASYEAAGGENGRIADLACSVEMVHAYSLVHDDLPCMDDDVLRRGRPTAHVQFGVRAAVLGGAILMPLAVRAVLRGAARLDLSEKAIRRLIGIMTAASGARGMVGGQLLDLKAEGRAVRRDDLEEIHRGKTAALISAACVMGGIAAGAAEEDVGRLERFGKAVGMAFQVVDDILDMRGTAGELGKQSGRDLELGKATYPAILGIEDSERVSREWAERAVESLAGLPRPERLREISRYVIDRRH